MKKTIIIIAIAAFLAACEKERTECPPQTQSPVTSVVNPIEGFWYYSNAYTWYGANSWYTYPFAGAFGNRFIIFDQDSATIYLDDCSLNNADAGIVKKPYRVYPDGTMIIKLQPEFFYQDSVFYPSINGDTLYLQTRGQVHPSPSVNDSVYDRLYFTKY